MANKELLQKTLAYIEAHPEEWNQFDWFCGSAACFAGHACLLSGDTRRSDSEIQVNIGGRERSPGFVRYRAETLLDISTDEGDALFDSMNTLADLRRIVAELCA